MPDRLPSLIVLVGCWVPAVIAGRAAADFAHTRANRVRPAMIYAALTVFVFASVALWFFVNVIDMPPYIPGATMNPNEAPPAAVKGLAVFTSAIVLPATALACWLAFRGRARALTRSAAR